MPRKNKWMVFLEKKYMREHLGGSTYIDTRQRPHFRKWAKKQIRKMGV